MRVATIDIGTNSVLLLVVELRGGDLVPIVDRATITRLGQGVDRSRALAPEAVLRTLACLERYAADIRAAGADRVDVVGTSAMRDAKGGEDFRARASDLLGVTPRVISGDEEAALTFEGAVSGLDLPDGDAVVFDVGGGSTEVILGHTGGVVRAAMSLDVGSVRLTERHIRADPPSPAELEAVRADVRVALAALPPVLASASPATPLVGVAGTVTTLAAVIGDVFPYDGARVHGARITAEALRSTTDDLARLPLAQRRALPALDPGRADVIVAGALLVDEIVRWRPSSGGFIVSDRGVRWGLARRLAFSEAPPRP